MYVITERAVRDKFSTLFDIDWRCIRATAAPYNIIKSCNRGKNRIIIHNSDDAKYENHAEIALA